MRLSYNRRWLAILLGLLLGFLCGRGWAQEMTIDAQVDRNQIQAGETIRFTLALNIPMENGGGQLMAPPQVDSIPGFDIVSRSTAQNMTWVNNQGMAQIQTRYELMPQQPGKAVIPGFSLKAPNGKTLTTKPIEIMVQEPTTKPEEDSSAGADGEENAPQGGGIGFLKGLFLFLAIVGLVISIPIGLSMFLTRGNKPAADRATRGTKPAPGQRGRPSAAAIPPDGPTVSPGTAFGISRPNDEAEIVEPIPVVADFDLELAALKRQFPEATAEFYRHLFDLFRRAVLARAHRFGQALTPDELLRAIGHALPPVDGIRVQRLSSDWEMVAYAGLAPSRGAGEILDDIRALLQSLRRLENQPCHR